MGRGHTCKKQPKGLVEQLFYHPMLKTTQGSFRNLANDPRSTHPKGSFDHNIIMFPFESYLWYSAKSPIFLVKMAQDEVRDKISQEKASYRVNDINGSRNRRNGDTSQRDRNPPKFRESRRNTGYRRGAPKFRESEKSYDDYNNNLRKSEQNGAKENINFADVVKSEDSKTIPNKQSVIKEVVTNSSEQDLQTVQQKSKPSHGHYHHKNSNKPRFAKAFSENGKEMKKQGIAAKVNGIDGMEPGKVPVEPVSVEAAAQVVEQLQTSQPDNESAKTGELWSVQTLCVLSRYLSLGNGPGQIGHLELI